MSHPLVARRLNIMGNNQTVVSPHPSPDRASILLQPLIINPLAIIPISSKLIEVLFFPLAVGPMSSPDLFHRLNAETRSAKGRVVKQILKINGHAGVTCHVG
jgi:hypothetical protein